MQFSDPVNNTGILEEILRSLKEKPGGHWATSDLLRRANIVQREICKETECLRLVDTSNLSVTGTVVYNKPSGCTRVTRVAYGKKRLFGVLEAELDFISSRRQHWQDDTHYPARYIDNLPSMTQFTIVPPPQEDGTTITVEYVGQPTDMVNNTDIPFLALNNLYQYHDLIVAGVVYRCLLEDKNQFYSEWKSIFNNGKKDMKEALRNMPDTLMTTHLSGRRGGGFHGPLPGMRI